MDERDLKPSDIRSTSDLVKLPILTKDMVRELGAELLSTGVPSKQRVYGHTGGTTGKSLQLYSDKNTQPHQWAVWWRHRKRFGLSLDDEFIVFAGRNVIPLNRMEPPFWRRNIPMHQTYVSIHHMTKQNMSALIEYLQKRKVKYYSGYPSAVYLVAQYMMDNNIRLIHPPDVTVLGAETLLPHQRRAMENAFGGKITDQYGASEQCGNISDCEHGHYHVDMEFGHIEFLPLEGSTPNVQRIICTGFWNEAMPLIRYDIGDLATLPSKEVDCSCGRRSPVVEKIDGRIESYIITPDGRQAGRLDFIFKDSQHIEEAQFIQDEISTVKIKVVRAKGFSSIHEKELLADLRKYLGEVIQFEINYVSEIPRTANGKFRQIVSNVFKDQNQL
ncbi:MAG: hypothetical protein PHP95_08910 [Desulfuromonadaceae bacterium]|nr:hypothetical protein [Desulfuromonadaceae bacterium]MDD2848562.1 hypothetical protein [Desulfuromonadaceae bacterium]MDD4131536.1 hypothetical protein [Desulfuromonadaceae bacterium]